MSASTDLIAAIRQAGEAYASFVETLDQEQFHRRPGPEEWSAAEITGHVAEAPATFARHAARLASHPGETIGRAPDDPGRLAAVARLGNAGPKEGAQLVRDGISEACAILETIPEEGWQVRGQNPRLGEPTVLEFVRGVALDHVRGHLDQARAAASV
ncbi:MAG: DinB family protein [Chloroflexi bacterium]|nr:DinB family protein [Chloroflexota bacterium]